MQFIACPWCGPREEVEFHYGGQADITYPADPAATSDQEWAAYVFYRDNPRGLFRERWSHSHGCRRWFTAVRDTATYRFHNITDLPPRPAPTDTAPTDTAHPTAHPPAGHPPAAHLDHVQPLDSSTGVTR